MNKGIALTVTVALLGLTTGLYADGCSSFLGNTSCSNGTMPSLQATGNAKTNQTTVQQAVTVGGNFSGTKSSLGSLQVKGKAELSNTTVFGNVSVGSDFRADSSSIGSLNVQGKTMLNMSTVQKASQVAGDFAANMSHFSSLTLGSPKATLNKSSASSVIVKAPNAVVCVNASQISHLTFSQGNGAVYQGSNSHITSLTGGKVMQGNCPF